MEALGEKLIGDAEHFPFEQRIFHFTILLAACLTAFGTLMDIYYRVSIVVDLFFVGCWILTYYISRFKGYFHLISMISIGVFVFTFIPYNWISSSGSSGVLPYYTIIFIPVISIVLTGRFRIMMIVSLLCVELLLIARDALQAGSFYVNIPNYINFFNLSIHLGVIMVATAVLLVVYSETYMREKARSEQYAITVEEQYQQQLYYMENLEELIDKLKAERHDFNNHLGVVYGLLQMGKPHLAGDYARQLVKNAEEYQNLVSIPYTMLRAMLNYKLSAARENGIQLRLNLDFPAGLELNEFDITVILGNLLDNAVEACAAIESDECYIDLSILYKPDYLIMQVENPVQRELLGPDGRRRSTKTDAENHGFGLRNIEYLVNKHNGLMKLNSGKGVFKVDIALLVDARPK